LEDALGILEKIPIPPGKTFLIGGGVIIGREMITMRLFFRL